jgi:zinc protease
MTDAFTLPIQVVGAGPLSAWLVEDHSVPVVSVAWAWPGGASMDTAGHEGTAALAAAMLTEGAGDLRALAFADALRDSAIGLNFTAGRDNFEGSFRCLADALPEALRLAKLAMTAPRMDADALERVRARAIAGARTQLETPARPGRSGLLGLCLPRSPGGPATERHGGKPDDHPARGAVGNARCAAPARWAAGGRGRRHPPGGACRADAGPVRRPARRAPATPPPLPRFASFGRQVVPVPGPQSQVVFGQPGIPPQDPSWETAQIVLRVLGGGGFSSRLMEAVRVQRGLTYGVGVGIDTLFGGGVIAGSFATENGKVAEAPRRDPRRLGRAGPAGPDRRGARGIGGLSDRLAAAAIHRQPADRRDAAGHAAQRPAA